MVMVILVVVVIATVGIGHPIDIGVETLAITTGVKVGVEGGRMIVR